MRYETKEGRTQHSTKASRGTSECTKGEVEVEPPDSLKEFLQLYTAEILQVYQLAKSILWFLHSRM